MVGDSTSVEDPWSTSTGLSLLLTAVCRKSFRCVPHPHEKTSQHFHSCNHSLVWLLFSSPQSHRVILGEHDRQYNSEQIQVKSIAKVSNNITLLLFIYHLLGIIGLYWLMIYANLSIQAISHPYYNAQNFNSDITLLKLSSPVQMTSRVSPVCLASSSTSIPSGTKCVTTGWGRTGQTCEWLISFEVLHADKIYRQKLTRVQTPKELIYFCSWSYLHFLHLLCIFSKPTLPPADCAASAQPCSVQAILGL